MVRGSTPAIAMLLASGCASARPTPGNQYSFMEAIESTLGTTWSGQRIRLLYQCTPYHYPDQPALERRCDAVLTDSPADGEAWLFEARLRAVVNGIPFGREPVDYFVAGTREQCEAARQAFRHRPHPFFGQETPPTEACKGPFYFKLNEAAAKPQ